MKNILKRTISFLLAANMALSGAVPALAFELEKIGEEATFSEEETIPEPEEIIPDEAAPEEMQAEEVPAPDFSGKKVSILADINLDGSVNVMDAYYARLVAAKLIRPTEQQILLGDVDLDGKITALDANIIRKFAVKIITEIPVKK